ncbi:nucleolar protein 16 [Atheta coriaria]|uniref:nucleolar protein 16 n=1 Tax=Dalotia coriaria TaxID=877792 RepID=UPI0031F3C915
MPKLRKQRRRKVYNHNRNRKRLRNKQFSEGNINCKEIKSAWDSKKSLQTNLKEMGICYDPNDTFKITVTRKEKLAKAKALATSKDESADSDHDEWDVEDLSQSATKTPIESKKHVLEALIDDANAPRAKMFRLPKGQVDFITYMLTKHGLDFKAMAKDKKNYNQETWKQLRGKVRRFQCIPEQYEKFLATASKDTIQKLQNEIQMEDDD